MGKKNIKTSAVVRNKIFLYLKKNCVLIFNFFLLMHMNLTNLTIIISLPSFKLIYICIHNVPN